MNISAHFFYDMFIEADWLAQSVTHMSLMPEGCGLCPDAAKVYYLLLLEIFTFLIQQTKTNSLSGVESADLKWKPSYRHTSSYLI